MCRQVHSLRQRRGREQHLRDRRRRRSSRLPPPRGWWFVPPTQRQRACLDELGREQCLHQVAVAWAQRRVVPPGPRDQPRARGVRGLLRCAPLPRSAGAAARPQPGRTDPMPWRTICARGWLSIRPTACSSWSFCSRMVTYGCRAPGPGSGSLPASIAASSSTSLRDLRLGRAAWVGGQRRRSLQRARRNDSVSSELVLWAASPTVAGPFPAVPCKEAASPAGGGLRTGRRPGPASPPVYIAAEWKARTASGCG